MKRLGFAIKMMKGKSINLEVEDNSNTIDLKIHGEPIGEIVMQLGPGRDQDIATMLINLVTFRGKKHTFKIKRSNTIEEIKNMWEEKEGAIYNCTSRTHIEMFFASQVLEDSLTVAEYNIKNDSTIHVMYHLCGC